VFQKSPTTHFFRFPEVLLIYLSDATFAQPSDPLGVDKAFVAVRFPEKAGAFLEVIPFASILHHPLRAVPADTSRVS